jgi:hypothetical protein
MAKAACIVLDDTSLNILEELANKRSKSMFINAAIRHYYENCDEARKVFFQNDVAVKPTSGFTQSANTQKPSREKNEDRVSEKEEPARILEPVEEKKPSSETQKSTGVKLDDW